jgi:cytochrome c oxidase subunit 4
MAHERNETAGHGMDHGSHHGDAVGGVHVVPVSLLLAVWGALVVLTVVTVAASWIDVGPFNLLLAMAIATVKGALVVLYFMHLRWDRPFNAVVFIGSLAFVALFIVLALMDTAHYQPELIPGHAPALQQQ